MEIPVSRLDISISSNALRWSDSGDIAIAGTNLLVVYVPELNVAGSSLKWKRIDNEILESQELNPSNSENLGPRSSVVEPPLLVADVCWSPQYMTSNRGNFLAYVTTKFEVHVLVCEKNPLINGWIPAIDMMKQLALDRGYTDAGKSGITLRVTAVAWSQAKPDPAPWGRSYLAIALDQGDIFIYKVSDGIFEFSGLLKDDARRSPILMAWTSNGLAVAFEDNSVLFKRLNLEKEGIELEKDTQIAEPSRFLVSLLRNTRHGLVVYKTANVVLVSSDGQNVVSKRIDYSTAAAGLVENGDSWALIFYDGGVYVHDSPRTSKGGLVGVTDFLEGRRVSQSGIRVYGAASLPYCPTGAILYGTYPEGAWQFPIPSAQCATLQILACGAEYDLSSSLRSEVSLDSNAINLLAHSRHLNASQAADLVTETDYDQLLADVKRWASQPLTNSLKTLLCDKTFKRLVAQAFFGVSGVEHHIRQVLASLIVSHYKVSGLDGLSLLDRAIVQSYSQFANEAQPSEILQTPVTMENVYFSETFQLSDQKDPQAAVSEAGRAWKRCAITLLPIISLQTRRSVGSDLAAILSTELGQSELGKQLLSSVEINIYNGRRWFDR